MNNQNPSGVENTAALAHSPQGAYYPAKGTSGLAVSGLILGVLAIFGSWIPILNLTVFPLIIVGVALSIAGFVTVHQGKKEGQMIAIAAIVVNIVALFLFYNSSTVFSYVLSQFIW